MSAYDFSGIFDIVRIKRTDVIGDTLSTVVAYLWGPKRGNDKTLAKKIEESDGEPIDWWQNYGFLSRPPDNTESLVARIGTQTFAIASRFLGATGFGKLLPGDVALYSIGKCAIRLNANGSISIIAPDKKGKQLIGRFDPKGEITLMLGNGFIFQLSEENGLIINTPGKDVTIACKNMNVIAQAFNNNSPVMKANIAAVLPLSPTSVNPGFFAGV